MTAQYVAKEEELLKNFTSEVDKHLHQLIKYPEDIFQKKLWEAAKYSLFTPGKRLRPLLLLATAYTFSGSIKKALTPACCIEFIHTYSLIHDDLPCMDDDDFRRGMPSLHKKFNEATAVLTGDFLLTYAFEALSDSPFLSSESKLDLIRILSKASGGLGMIGGQVLDIEYENEPLNSSLLYAIHKGKTAELISASIEMGGVISSVTTQTMNYLREFGINLGLAFQLHDDILDANESTDKSTAISLYGLDRAIELRAQFKDKALSSLSNIDKPAPLLEFLAEKMLR